MVMVHCACYRLYSTHHCLYSTRHRLYSTCYRLGGWSF